MTRIITIVLAAAAFLGAVSCERQFEKTKLSPAGDCVAPVLGNVGDVIVNQVNNKVEAVVFNWTSADFGAPVEISYQLFMTYGDKEALIGQSYSNSLTVSKADLNGVACAGVGVGKNETAEVGAYLLAAVNGTDTAPIRSNDITFNITTFDAPKTSIYMPGYYQGWNQKGTELWEMEGGTKIYRILAEFKEDETNTPGICPFKLVIGDEWTGISAGYTATWDGYDYGDKDGNFGIPAGEEVNFVTVDLNKKQLSREFVKCVSVIGSIAECGGDWSKDVYFTYDASANVWATPAVTLAADTEFLVRMKDDWGMKFGDAVKASSEVEGGFELTQSGDAANIKPGLDGTYVIKLYGNRTPLVIVYEQQ